jgi:hypothetical protein
VNVNPKYVKFAVKGVLGIGVSALIGATIKQEAKIADLIDSHFASKANN